MASFTVHSARALHYLAHQAGMAAGNAHNPRPMVVQDADVLTGAPIAGGRSYYVSEGLCGRAWVAFKGNTSFGRAMKAAGLARPNYPTGLRVWCGEFNQSYERKDAYARAYARVLQEHNVDCYADSNLD